jgi:hypothetical protein
MNDYASLAERALYFDLNLVAYLMSLLQANVPGDYQVKVYIALASSPTCP